MSNWKPTPNGYFKPENQSNNIDVPKPGDTVSEIEINTIGHAGTSDKYSRADHAHTISGAASEADLNNLSVKVNNKENVGVAESLVDAHNLSADAHTEIMTLKADKTYVDAQVSTRPGDNILINTDFRNPINQRGTPYNTDITGAGYGIDRWTKGVYPTTGTFQYSVSTDGLKVSADENTAPSGFRQYIENTEAYRGKTLTLSAKIRKKALANLSFTIGDGNSDHTLWISLHNDESWTYINRQYEVADDATRLSVGVWSATLGSWFEIAWVKLEEGPIATPWTVPDPAAELARCQRYCFAVRDAHVYMSAQAGSNPNTFYGSFYFPVQMRIKPVIANPDASDLSDFYLHVPSVSGNHPVVGVNWGAVSTVCCQCAAQVTVTPTWTMGAPGRLYVPNRPVPPYIFDAEL